MTHYKVQVPQEAVYPPVPGQVPAIVTKMRATGTFTAATINFDVTDTLDTDAYSEMPDMRFAIRPRVLSGTKSIVASAKTIVLNDRYNYKFSNNPDAVNTSYHYVDAVQFMIDINGLDSLKKLIVQGANYMPEAPLLASVAAGAIDASGSVLAEGFAHASRQMAFERKCFYDQTRMHAILELQSRHPNVDVNAGYENSISLTGSTGAYNGFISPQEGGACVILDFQNDAESQLVAGMIAMGAGAMGSLAQFGADKLAKAIGSKLGDMLRKDASLGTKVAQTFGGSLAAICADYASAYIGALAFGSTKGWCSLSDFSFDDLVNGAVKGMALVAGAGLNMAGNAMLSFMPTSTVGSVVGSVLSGAGNFSAAYGAAVGYLEMVATKTVWVYW